VSYAKIVESSTMMSGMAIGATSEETDAICTEIVVTSEETDAISVKTDGSSEENIILPDRWVNQAVVQHPVDDPMEGSMAEVGDTAKLMT